MSTAFGLVEVRRGSYVESVHSFAACVVGPGDEVLQAVGDVNSPYPIRSLAKPFIAAEFVRSGAVDAFGLGETEIALSAGSHDGEPIHIAAVGEMLKRQGLDESALLCGPALEGKVRVGPPIANNCSGKHAAILTMCRHYSLPIERYTDSAHALERKLVPRLMLDFGVDPALTDIAVDGCGLPIFGATLRQIACAYARFGASNEPAFKRVRAAMTARPEYIGGSNGNLDTTIIAHSQRTVLGKIGAEGLHADTLVGGGIGLAVKVLDGNSRALPPILAQFIGSMDGKPAWLDELRSPIIYNCAGDAVGEVAVSR